MTLIEMEGFLRGKCLPGDILVGENNAQYLLRKLSAANELQRQLTAYEATVTNLTAQVQGLAAENGQMLRLLTDISENHGEFVNEDDDYMYASVPLDYVSEINMYVSRDVNAENPFEHTDAALAEIRNDALIQYANKTGFSFQHGSIHAHFGNGNVMVGSVTFEDGSAGINFAPVREKLGGVGTDYEWTKGKNTDDVDSVFVISSSNAAGLQVIRNKLDEAIDQLRKEQGK